MKRLGLLLFLCTAGLQAQTVAAPIPVANQQFLDCRTGVCLPLVGGKLYSYAAGTVTPLVTYTDSGGATPNANPVVLNASGYNTAGGGNAGVWIRGACYKFILKDVADVTLWTQDNVCNQDALTKAALLATYASTAGASLIGYKSAATGSVATTLAKKAAETVSAQSDFGAKGDDSTDDTAAIQACIDYSANNRASCYLPPAIYKITGAGLHMLTSFSSVESDQSEGNGAAVLKYYGTGTALTIGTGSSLIFAVNLKNIAIAEATATTAQYGINSRGLSGGDWPGVSVIGIGTGKFTTGIRFSDSGLLTITHLTMNIPTYAAGTTGILFDVFNSFGNDQIFIDKGDLSNIAHMYDIKSCISCVVRDIYMENMDYFVWIDNTVAWSANSGIANFLFDGAKFSTSGTGPVNHKILQVNSTGGNLLSVSSLVFRSCSMFLSGGVTYPFSLNIPSVGAGSSLKITLDTNNVQGANGAIFDANNFFAQLYLGQNVASDTSGTGTRPPDLHGTATVTDFAPADVNQYKLAWLDASGSQFLAGSTANDMTRPTAGFGGRGVIEGVSGAGGSPYNADGFLRIGAGGGAPVPPATVGTTPSANVYCDFSGFSAVTDMNRNIVCFLGGTELMRLDVNGLKIGIVSVFANNAAAIGAGLPVGALYRITATDQLGVVH